MSELLKTLRVAEQLMVEDTGAEGLAFDQGVSVATVKRYIQELRHLGCQIVSRCESHGWVYRLENADQVRTRLVRWIELERSRTLIES